MRLPTALDLARASNLNVCPDYKPVTGKPKGLCLDARGRMA